MGWIRPPKKRTRRRLLWLAGLMVGLLLLEEIPRIVFSFAVGQSFSSHPLGPLYNLLVIVFNVFVVVIVLLGDRLRRAQPKLYTAMLGFMLFTLWSALWLELVDRQSLYSFQLVLWHMLAGRFGAAILIVYTLQHLLLWWPGAPKAQRRAGGLLTFGVAVAFGLGLLFSVLGGPELLGLLTIHRWVSWVIVAAIVWHVIVSRRLGAVARDEGRKQRQTLTRRQLQHALLMSVLLFLPPYALARQWVQMPHPITMIFQFIENTSTDLPVYTELDADYPEPFGEGPFRPARATLDTGRAVPEARFLNQANGCGYEGCHTDIAKQWSVSAHRAARNVFVERVMAELERERGIEATRYCAGCHDPVNLLTGRVRPDGEPIVGVENEGVTCMVCHTADDLTDHPGNASYRLARTPLFFERFLARSRYLATVLYLDDHRAELKRETLHGVELCGSCHTHVLAPEIADAGLTLSDKVAEWRAGPYADPASAQGRRTCIDCHMPEVTESYQQTIVRSHRFLSSNTGVPAYHASVVARGAAEEPELAPEHAPGGLGPDEIEQRPWDWDMYGRRYLRGVESDRFTNAEQVALEQNHVRSGAIRGRIEWRDAGSGEAALDVALENAGVGHSFPAGPHDLMEVWLELTVTDGAGATVWQSGALDDDGRLDPHAERLGSSWFDADGERLVHHEIWRIAEVRDERRIASGETLRLPYRFDVPADAVPPLSATLRLRHRRYRPDFVEWALGDDARGFELPITDILTVTEASPSP